MKWAAALALAAALGGCVADKEPVRSTAARSGPGYVVREGDTLSAIAQRYGLQLSELARANGIPPPYLIRVGQRLAIPARSNSQPTISRPVVQPLPRSTAGSAPTPSPTPAPAPRSSPAIVQPTGPMISGAPRLVWPTDGPVSQGFGSGTDPKGINFSTHAGAAVRAAAAGTVLFAGPEPQRYGVLVLVDHGGGWVTAYGNLSRIVVSVGEKVSANSRLGFTGERGLHFQLRRDNAPVDPLPQMPPRF